MKTLSSYVSPFGRGVPARIAYKAVADVAGKAAMFVVTVAAARALPRDAFGLLALALTTGWLLGVAADAGLSMYLARAAARARQQAWATLVTALRVRLFLSAIAVALLIVLARWWAPEDMRAAFVIIAASQLAGTTLEMIGHVLRGLDRSEVEAHVHLAQRLVMVVAAVAVLQRTASVDHLALALLLPPLLAIPIMTAMVRHLGRRESAAGSRTMPSMWTMARDAAPLGAAVLISALYFRIDVLFVERWHGLDVVAGYNAVFRIVEAIRLVPAAVLAVMFPALCRADDAGVVRGLTAWLGAGGVVIAGLLAVVAPWLVPGLYGARYADAAPVLQALALAVPLFFVNYALTHQVIGWDGQRAYLAITVAALAANVVANLALIPRYAALGAAAATTLTEIVVAGGCVGTLAWQMKSGRAAAAVRGGVA